MLGDGIKHLEAALVVKVRAGVETLVDKEVSGQAGAEFVVNYDRAANGANWVASKLKGPLKCSQADMSGARVDQQRMFSVSLF